MFLLFLFQAINIFYIYYNYYFNNNIRFKILIYLILVIYGFTAYGKTAVKLVITSLVKYDFPIVKTYIKV